MLQTPIDGDEPFYLLAAESIMHDRDFDLSNQYREPRSSVTGRTDLGPQPGDPVGSHGEVYTRHPPLLPLLIIPGLAIAGLPGAIAVIAIFGALLIRSTLNLMEDEGISRATQRIVFPFFAFGPPVLFYSTRIWPEVPAAFLFVEALRGVRDRRVQRWLPAVIALGLLKLRFALVGLPLVLIGMGRDRRSIWRRGGSSFRQVTLRSLLVVAVVAVPMLVAWLIHGNPLNVHAARELLPWSPKLYLIGSFGLLVDGSSGLLFQAPFYLLGVFAIMRWRSMPESFRMGCMAALLYLFYLVPRSEWHGGWSPALRYVVIFTPVLALGAAVLLEERGARRWLPPIAVWTIAIAVHGVVYPWRLFHIANGENVTGEMLSTLFASDFSRLFPSLIRLNSAAVVASIALVVALLLFRFVRIAIPAPLVATTLTMLIAIGFTVGRQAGRIVEFEDIHVKHDGGALYPEVFTVARFRFRGGWIVRAGDSLSVMTPDGRFGLAVEPSATRVLAAFAAGSGITPILSIMKTVLAGEPGSRFFLFYGNRATDSILFRAEIEDLKDRFLSRLSVFHVLSREQQDVPVLNGHLDAAKLAVLLPSLPPIDHAFVCGPQPMIEGLGAALLDLGLPKARLHIERFTPSADGRPPAPVAPDAPPLAIATVISEGARTDIPMAEGEAIIDAAIRAGRNLPYSCKGGMCCTCRAKVLEGRVAMAANYSLEPWETEAGFVLTCQARPLTPHVTVDFDAV